MSNKMAKKKIKKAINLVRIRQYDHILQESFEDFKDRLMGMPINMLLIEYQTLSEYYGIQTNKEKIWWSGANKDLFDRVMFVRDKIMEKVHQLHDSLYTLEYQVDEAYRVAEKKEKNNVEVSKKSNKQSK
jgi:hypothetical protein